MRIPLGTAVLGFIAVTAVIGDTTGLDPAFGVGGKVVTDVSGRYDEIRALAIQGDGRIVVAGVTGTTPRRDFAIARYHADGSLDFSFAEVGTAVTDFGGGDDVAWAVAVQADGKIVVGGTADGNFALARYSEKGALDPQFGDGGRVVVSLGSNARVNALTIQPDGRIVGVGAAAADFALIRLQANGTPDVTFGTDGRVLTDFSGGPDTGFAVTIRTDGRIVAAGSTGAYPMEQFAVAQYDADGTLDSAFGVGGKARVAFPRSAGAHALVLQPDGKLRVGGFINHGSSIDGIVVQLTLDGTVDTSFGDRGRVESDFGGRNFAAALAFQSDGRFVVGGFDDFPPYYDFAIARYDPAGSRDASFNQEGTILTEFGNNSWINAVAVQQDGDVVAAGYARGPGGADFALVRYSNRR